METLRNAVKQHSMVFLLIVTLTLVGAYLYATTTQANTPGVIGTLSVSLLPVPSSAGFEKIDFLYDGIGNFDMTGVVIENSGGDIYTFGQLALASGMTYRVCQVTAPNCDDTWGGVAAWSDMGDTLTLKDSAGNEILTISYNDTLETGESVTGSETVTGLIVNNKDNILVCHVDKKGLFQAKSASVQSLVRGKGGHNAHMNDIIPPFIYQLNNDIGSFEGQNWNPVNEGILLAGC